MNDKTNDRDTPAASGNKPGDDKGDQHRAKAASKSDRSKPVRSKAKASRFSWKKWLMIGGVALVGVAMAAWMLKPSEVEVTLALATRGPLSVSVDAQGQTRAKLRYTVAAPISGRLLRTRLTVGDRVEQGDVLARIAPPPTDARSLATTRAELVATQARERQAAATLREAQSTARVARKEAVRRAELFRMGMISAESRDTYAQAASAADARVASARANGAAAEADVQSAKSRLLGAGAGAADAGAISILAPVSGAVLKVAEESERVVAAGSPLFEMSQGNELELVVDVLTQDAVQIKSGDAIRITGWGGSAVLEGNVRHVEPGAFTKVSALGVEEQRVNVIGDLTNSPPSLGAGYRIEAAIVTWTGADVLQIPTGALFRRDSSWQTFVAEDGRARLRKLEIGHRNAEYAEILKGIAPGDPVIVFPSDLVVDGVRVHDGSAGAAR